LKENQKRINTAFEKLKKKFDFYLKKKINLQKLKQKIFSISILISLKRPSQNINLFTSIEKKKELDSLIQGFAPFEMMKDSPSRRFLTRKLSKQLVS